MRFRYRHVDYQGNLVYQVLPLTCSHRLSPNLAVSIPMVSVTSWLRMYSWLSVWYFEKLSFIKFFYMWQGPMGWLASMIAYTIYQFFMPIKSQGNMRPCIKKYLYIIVCEFVENCVPLVIINKVLWQKELLWNICIWDSQLLFCISIESLGRPQMPVTNVIHLSSMYNICLRHCGFELSYQYRKGIFVSPTNLGSFSTFLGPRLAIFTY